MPGTLWQSIDTLLEPVELPVRFFVEKPMAPIDYVYFPVSGIASTVVSAGRDKRAEVGIFGREGMSGIPVVMGGDRSLQECFFQVAGKGVRVESDALRKAMDDAPALRVFFLRFVQAMLMQTSQTAVSNAQSVLEERLCRWLLMSHDRLGQDELELTHEFLSIMLGVRRAGVTSALHILEGRHLIKSTRGLVVILDREGLEAGAGGSYGQPESEYERLIGYSLRGT